MWKDVLTQMLLHRQYQLFNTLNNDEKKALFQHVKDQILVFIQIPGADISEVMQWTSLLQAIGPLMTGNTSRQAAPTRQVASHLSNSNFYHIRDLGLDVSNITDQSMQFFLEKIYDVINKTKETESEWENKKPLDNIEVTFDDPQGTKGKILEQIAWNLFNGDRVFTNGLLMIRQHYEYRILSFQGVGFIQQIEQTIINELALYAEEEEEELTTATRYQPGNQSAWTRASALPLVEVQNDNDNDYRPETPPFNPS